MADRSSIGDRIAEIESRKGRWAWQATEDIEFLLAEIERLNEREARLWRAVEMWCGPTRFSLVERDVKGAERG